MIFGVELVIDKVKQMGDERRFDLLAVVDETLSRDKHNT